MNSTKFGVARRDGEFVSVEHGGDDGRDSEYWVLAQELEVGDLFKWKGSLVEISAIKTSKRQVEIQQVNGGVKTLDVDDQVQLIFDGGSNSSERNSSEVSADELTSDSAPEGIDLADRDSVPEGIDLADRTAFLEWRIEHIRAEMVELDRSDYLLDQIWRDLHKEKMSLKRELESLTTAELESPNAAEVSTPVSPLSPLAPVICPRCGAGGWLPGEVIVGQCQICGNRFNFLRCSKKLCLHVSIGEVGDSKAARTRSCSKCASQLRSIRKVTLDSYSKSNPQLARSWIDKGRRHVLGTVADSSGYLGVVAGEGCALIFNEDSLVVQFAMAGVHKFSFSAITMLDFGGPGEVATTSGGGWIGGGFGLQGAAVGIATASVLNRLTSRTRTSIRSIVGIGSSTHSLFIVNTILTPVRIRQLLDPAIQRIAAAQGDSGAIGTADRAKELDKVGSDRSESAAQTRVLLLKEIATLRDQGILTPAEFESEKRRILNGD